MVQDGNTDQIQADNTMQTQMKMPRNGVLESKCEEPRNRVRSLGLDSRLIKGLRLIFIKTSSYKIWTQQLQKCRTDQQLKQGSKVDLFQGQNVSLVQQQGTVQQGQKLGQRTEVLRHAGLGQHMETGKQHMNMTGEGNLKESSNQEQTRSSRKPRINRVKEKGCYKKKMESEKGISEGNTSLMIEENNNVHNSPSHEHQNNSTESQNPNAPKEPKHDISFEQVGYLTVSPLQIQESPPRDCTLNPIPATLDESDDSPDPVFVVCNLNTLQR
ncbi:hypothetical protein HAX54_000938 [Datura stramonium]|uniref:Uncharacterized protein n=1 Tax=Datura stramonium TaxID=4076 RepID=A0ABS8T1P7_DATST|nr:hypothetical protein [Datura stramonium]